MTADDPHWTRWALKGGARGGQDKDAREDISIEVWHRLEILTPEAFRNPGAALDDKPQLVAGAEPLARFFLDDHGNGGIGPRNENRRVGLRRELPMDAPRTLIGAYGSPAAPKAERYCAAPRVW